MEAETSAVDLLFFAPLLLSFFLMEAPTTGVSGLHGSVPGVSGGAAAAALRSAAAA